MKIKKYIGTTEKEAMFKIKEELGMDALIVNVKKVKPRGIYKLFKKPYVEMTAALDDKPSVQAEAQTSVMEDMGFLQALKDVSRKQLNQSDSIPIFKTVEPKVVSDTIMTTPIRDEHQQVNPLLSMLYEQLLDSELDETIINGLFEGLQDLALEQAGHLDHVVGVLYKRIVNLLSDVEPISVTTGVLKTAVFVGPTGVGKTTTIAKIASYFTLTQGLKVGLITSDTYRIAAVEQLRTYANILNIPIKVVYNINEIKQAIESYRDLDLILVDTAGRSHKNQAHHEEMMALLDTIAEKEVYLVLSLATKYKDLLKICECYQSISDYKLIFTKLDETAQYGNIINIKEKTGAKLSYVTFGQNVPDDISEFDTHDIAKKTIGGCEI